MPCLRGAPKDQPAHAAPASFQGRDPCSAGSAAFFELALDPTCSTESASQDDSHVDVGAKVEARSA